MSEPLGGIGPRIGRILKKEWKSALTSKPRKVLFDHLPKCGGTTLNRYLASHYPRRHIYTIDGINQQASIDMFKELSQRDREKYCLIRGHNANALIEYCDNQMFAVTVLREPVSRVISHYYYAKNNIKHYLYDYLNENDVDISGYLDCEQTDENENWYVQHFSRMSLQNVRNNPDKAIGLALENLRARYDLIGFLDHFSEFTDSLEEKAGFWNAYAGSRENSNPDRSYISEISPEIIRKVESRNSLDIALYDVISKESRG